MIFHLGQFSNQVSQAGLRFLKVCGFPDPLMGLGLETPQAQIFRTQRWVHLGKEQVVEASLAQIRFGAGLAELELHGTKPVRTRLPQDRIHPTLEDNRILPLRVGQFGLDF